MVWEKILGDVAKEVVTTGIKSFFGSSDTPRVPQQRAGQVASSTRVPDVVADPPANPAGAGTSTAIGNLINRHAAIMDSIGVDKGARFSKETTLIS